MEFVVFGIHQIDSGFGMMLWELLFEGNELISFFGIS